MARLALATAQACGPACSTAVRELAAALEVPLVLLAVVTQDENDLLRTLAVCLDGQIRPNFDFPASALAAVARSFFAPGR